MKKTLISFLILLMVSGCNALTGAVVSSIAGGGGPSLEAQVGKENTKQIVGVQETNTAGRDVRTNESKVSTEKVDSVSIKETNIGFFTLVLLILGWMLPSPNQIGSWFTKLFRKKK